MSEYERLQDLAELLLETIDDTKGDRVSAQITGLDFFRKQPPADVLKLGIVAICDGRRKELKAVWNFLSRTGTVPDLGIRNVNRFLDNLDKAILANAGSIDDVIEVVCTLEDFEPQDEAEDQAREAVSRALGALSQDEQIDLLIAVAGEGSQCKRPELVSGALTLHFDPWLERSGHEEIAFWSIILSAFRKIDALLTAGE